MAYTRLKLRMCRLDPANGLARGVTFCAPFFEGGGNPLDLVSGVTSSVAGIGGTAPAWQQDLYGQSSFFSNPGASNQKWYSFANTPGFALSGSFTFAVRAKSLAWTNNTLFRSATYLDLTYNNFQGQGNNWISCQYYDGSGNVKRVGITSLPSTGVWHTYLITVVANVPTDFYVDDVKQSASTNSTTGVRAATGAMELGGGGAANGSNNQTDLSGSIDLFVMWNRVLTPGEIYSFARDPHQIFAVSRPWRGNSITASFLAAWAARSNQIIAGGSYVS